MNDGIAAIHQRAVLVVRKSEPLARQVPGKYADAGPHVIVEFRKSKMQLQRSPQALARLLLALCAHQKIQLVAVLGKQRGRHVAAEISGCAGYEDRHRGSDGVAELETTAARAFSGDQSNSRGARDSSGRPSING